MSEPGSMFNYGIPADNTPGIAQEMRLNFEALARSHYTTDPTFPTAPRSGQLRVLDETSGVGVKLQWYDGTAWVTLLQGIESDIATPLRREVNFASVASLVVDHYLGVSPVVQVVDSTGQLLQPVSPGPPGSASEFSMIHNSLDRVTLSFGASITGKVILIG